MVRFAVFVASAALLLVPPARAEAQETEDPVQLHAPAPGCAAPQLLPATTRRVTVEGPPPFRHAMHACPVESTKPARPRLRYT